MYNDIYIEQIMARQRAQLCLVPTKRKPKRRNYRRLPHNTKKTYQSFFGNTDAYYLCWKYVLKNWERIHERHGGFYEWLYYLTTEQNLSEPDMPWHSGFEYAHADDHYFDEPLEEMPF